MDETDRTKANTSSSRSLVHFTQNLLHPWRTVILIFTSVLSIIFYMYLNPPLSPKGYFQLSSLIPLAGDLPTYVVRFATSFIFLGVIPFVLVKILGFNFREMGLYWNWTFLKSKIFWLFFLSMVVTSVFSSLSPDLYNFYPYSKTLVTVVRNFPLALFFHALAYAFLYYLPWEILFRGILIFPFMTSSLQNPEENLEKNPQLFALASLQTFPTVLMHLPHPMVETLAAIPFGLIGAYLALRFRSVLPCFFIHATVGITLDAAIIFQQARG